MHNVRGTIDRTVRRDKNDRRAQDERISIIGNVLLETGQCVNERLRRNNGFLSKGGQLPICLGIIEIVAASKVGRNQHSL